MKSVEDLTVYELMTAALENILGTSSYYYDEGVSRLMGDGFLAKNWLKVSDHERDSCGQPFVSQTEYEKLKLYASPHGYALWRAKQAKGQS